MAMGTTFRMLICGRRSQEAGATSTNLIPPRNGLPGHSSKRGFERSLVGRAGLEPADGSDLWFKAHPKEEPMKHSLTVGRHCARLGHCEAPRAEPEGRK